MKITSLSTSIIPLLVMHSKLIKAFIVTEQQHHQQQHPVPVKTSSRLRRVVDTDTTVMKVTSRNPMPSSRLYCTSNSNPDKISWDVFWDLECPFARKNWEQLPALREAFDSRFDFTIHLTSLAFHPSGWIGQCAAFLIRRELDHTAWLAFVDAFYEHQHLYKDDLKDPRRSEVVTVFADIAQGAGLFTEAFTREYFV